MVCSLCLLLYGGAQASDWALFIMEEKHIYYKLDEKGVVRAIDMYTGDVVSLAGDDTITQRYNYSVQWGDVICEAVRSGKSIKQISEDPRFPPASIIYGWRSLHPDFKEKMQEARRDRAEYHRDCAVEIAEGTECKEEVNVNRLKIDTHKWAAAKDDPARYESNIKVEQHHTGQVGFFALRTGVPRTEEEKKLTLEETGDRIEDNCKHELEQRDKS